jgi:hypothetical protein
MKIDMTICLAVGILAAGCAGQQACAQSGTETSSGLSANEPQKPVLTPAQRRDTYATATKDKSKTAAVRFPPVVGAEVPPMLELHTLPDKVLAENHDAGFYSYTVENDKVVLVDPTRMRVVDVIGPDGN